MCVCVSYQKGGENNSGYNCRSKECHLKGKCFIWDVVYQATVKSPNGPDVVYVGLTERTGKEKFNNDISSFRNRRQTHKNILGYV